MSKLKPTRDIQPVTKLRANAAQVIELHRDVRQAEDQVAAGKGMTHAAVAKRLRARLRR